MFEPISKSDFQSRTGISNSYFRSSWDGAKTVTALRDLKEILNISDMPVAYLEQLIYSIRLKGDPNCFPFKGCKVDLSCTDPHHTKIGQTFVQRSKYQDLLENFPAIFQGFCLARGFSKYTAKIILGKTLCGKLAVAHYLPPIHEDHRSEIDLMDGIHRNFIVRSVGTTPETLIVRNVKTPFPATTHYWDDIKVVDEKPPIEHRFFDLKPELFRDLKAIGIDG